MSDADDRPLLRVVSGTPTAEELAVLTALVTAAGDDADDATPSLRGRWNDPARSHRRPMRPGPGAWRSSY